MPPESTLVKREDDGPLSSLRALIAGTRLFADLDEQAIDEISRRSRVRKYRRGELVFMEGDTGDSLFAVVSGLVKVYVTSARGDDLVLATVGPGESFGELSLLDGGGRSASAQALEESSLLIVDRIAFMELLHARPELVDRLLRNLGTLVRRLTDQAGDLVFLDLPGRIAKLLLSLGADAGSETDIELPFSQSELANMVGASRQTVNHVLRSFHATGFIELSGRRLRILRRDALRRRASD
jgi:CRP/FNR family transcriptional regulator, cyclic AMP receptor protein